MVRAISSLPVPVSPRMQTRDSLAATRSTCAMMRRMASPTRTISCRPTRRRNWRFSSSRRESFRTFSTVSNSLSVESGFFTETAAPRRVARTAISTLAWPDIITTGVDRPSAFRSSRKEMPSLPGMTTSEKIRSKRCVFTRARARAALSHTVASWPAIRKARASEASVFASSSTMRRCAILQFDPKSRAFAGLAFPRNPPSMIADNGLHDRQAQAGAVLLGGVVRRKQALALLPGEAGAGVGKFEHDCGIGVTGSQGEEAASGHGVERVQHQILQYAMELRGVGLDTGKSFGEF